MRKRIQHYLRKLYNTILRLRLKNRDFSLIASNCNGGCILHDLGLPFNSPFVNLWMKPKDFLRFCANMDEYLTKDFIFVTEEGISYPIGILGGDVRIYFQHYRSSAEAVEAWNRRVKRINRDNLFLLETDRDGWTEEDFSAFEALPYENKVIFCHEERPDFRSAVYIPGFEDQREVGLCMNFTAPNSFKKFYDAFDYVSWFNRGRPARREKKG